MTEGKYQLKPDLPFVPGMEVAGEIIAVDTDSGFAVDARRVRTKLANLDFAHAAHRHGIRTAYSALVRPAGPG